MECAYHGSNMTPNVTRIQQKGNKICHDILWVLLQPAYLAFNVIFITQKPYKRYAMLVTRRDDSRTEFL